MLRYVLILATLWTVAVLPLSAQCDSLLQAMSTAAGFRMNYIAANGVDTLEESVDSWCAKFIFDYMADSSQSTWAFSEFLLNRQKLMLAHWCSKRTVNWSDSLQIPIEEWSAATMRANSTTMPFMLHGGDTLQFYRTFHWADRSQNSVSFNRYVNQNSISYSVELVAASSGNRIALLDTTSFAPTTTSRQPSIYYWYPPASRVRYHAPTSLDSALVFMRVNTWSAGAGSAPFVRYDKYGRMRSNEEIGSSYWRGYVDSVRANNAAGASQCEVTIATISDPKALLISHGINPEFDHIAIFDLYGVQHWIGSTPLSSSPVQVTLSAGLYIVAAISEGSVICTNSIVLP